MYSQDINIMVSISTEDCTEILKNYLQTTENVKLISFEIKPISDNVEGFMGEHYKLVINYKFSGTQKSHIFFVKNKPLKNKFQGDITDSLGSYKREIFVYNTLINVFEKQGYDTSFAAKSYYTMHGEVLILEDVTLNGFSITERQVNLTVDHLKCALKSLAMFHAAGFAFERTKSKELERKFVLGQEYSEYMDEVFFVQYIDQTMFSMKWWTGFMTTLNELIDLLPHDETYKQEMKHMIKKAEVGKSFTTETNIKKSCCHGDLWSNNMLFKYNNNVPIQCCLVDFQMCRYFYPCYDVLLAIFCNTNSQFRKQYLEELYSFYFNTLSQLLLQYGLKIEEMYPLEDFYKSIDLVKVEALMQILLTNIIIFLPKEAVKEFMNDGESGVMKIMFDNVVLATGTFQKHEGYRNNITDTIYELRDALKQRCEQ